MLSSLTTRKRGLECLNDSDIFDPNAQNYETVDIVRYLKTEARYNTCRVPQSSLMDWSKSAAPKDEHGLEAEANFKLLVVNKKDQNRSLRISKDRFKETLHAFALDARALEMYFNSAVGFYILHAVSTAESLPDTMLCIDQYSNTLIWSFIPSSGLTRGILITNIVKSSDGIKAMLNEKKELVGHPLFPLIAVIAFWTLSCQENITERRRLVDQVAIQIGYHPWTDSVAVREFTQVAEKDFGTISKEVGGAALGLSQMNADTIFLSKSLRRAMETAFPRYTTLSSDLQSDFKRRNTEVQETALHLETHLENLLTRCIHYQESAKTVLTVVSQIVESEP
jgi:hypothetical protein